MGNSDTEVGEFYLKVWEGRLVEKERQRVGLFRETGAVVGKVDYLVKVCRAVNDFDRV